MKILYLDLTMGAAGDMLTAALMELLDDRGREEFLYEINNAGIPGVSVSAGNSVKCGITGTQVSVKVNGIGEEEINAGHGQDDSRGHIHEHEHNHSSHEHNHSSHEHNHGSHEHNHGSHEHNHSSMEDIEGIINSLSVSEKVREDAVLVYRLIAEAESHAHGRPVADIHFHEVGTMDAVADVTAVCMLVEKLAPDRIAASPVHVGCGSVECAHGILPVPAPATAYILKGVPTYGGNIHGELCTPTGAALIKYFVSEYGGQPVMAADAIGYGMGKKDFESANCVRALLGEGMGSTDTICGLSCNVDDMTAERIAFAAGKLFDAGARDVYTQSVGMKKCRQGTVINVLCDEADKENIIRQIFRHTTTTGIRETRYNRYVLDREEELVDTRWGKVRRKKSSGYGVTREKYEYDDLARIAGEQEISIEETIQGIEEGTV